MEGPPENSSSDAPSPDSRSVLRNSEPNNEDSLKNEKTVSFSPSDYRVMPIMTNIRPISELSSIGNLDSNRSFQTSATSTNSLVSSPSSISVDNSIECKNESRWSKRASFPRLHLYLQMSKDKQTFSPEQKNWKSGDSLEISTESFRYTGSNRCINDLDENFLSPKPASNLVKSYSFNTFSSYRKRSIDSVALTSSTRHISPRQKFTRALARTSSFRLQSSLNAGSGKPGTTQFSKLFNERLNHPCQLEKPKKSFFQKIRDFDRLQVITMLCILAVTFCSYCGCSILAPFFPKKIEEKGLSEFQSGCVFSVYSGVSIIFSPFLGKLVPKFGAKNMILFGVLIGGLSNLAFGMAGDINNPTAFLVLSILSRATESIGTSLQCTGAYTYIIKLFPNCIGFAFGMTECVIGVALTMGPVFGTYLFVLGGYKMPFFVFGFIVLLCFPMSWYFLASLHELPEPDDEKDCSSSDSETETVKATYDGMLRIPEILVICLVIVTMALAMSFLEPTFEPHMRKQYNVSESTVGFEFAVSSIAYAMSTPMVGYVSSFFPNKFTIMLIGTLVTLAGLLLIGPSALLFLPSDFWISSFGLVCISFGHGMAFIPTFECILDFCTKNGIRNDMKTHGKVSGLWSCLFSVGEFVGPMLAGSIVSKLGFPAVSTIVGAYTLLTVPFIVVMILKEIRDHAEAEADAFGNSLELNLNSKLAAKSGMNPFKDRPDRLFVVSSDRLFANSSNSGGCLKK